MGGTWCQRLLFVRGWQVIQWIFMPYTSEQGLVQRTTGVSLMICCVLFVDRHSKVLMLVSDTNSNTRSLCSNTAAQFVLRNSIARMLFKVIFATNTSCRSKRFCPDTAWNLEAFGYFPEHSAFKMVWCIFCTVHNLVLSDLPQSSKFVKFMKTAMQCFATSRADTEDTRCSFSRRNWFRHWFVWSSGLPTLKMFLIKKIIQFL